jgi:hypothetical protein
MNKKKIKTDANMSEQELSEIKKAIKHIVEDLTSSAEKKIKRLEAELEKIVTPAIYKEFAKMLEEFQSATSEQMAEKLKAVFEEKFLQFSQKHPGISEIEFLRSILPENFYISNNKLANEITKDFVDKG